MKLAVVLLSDQPMPNALFLRDFYDKWDKILFIETNRTQEKKYNKSILSILDKKQSDQIVVDENDLYGIESSFKEYFMQNSFDDILVNITGGTKIMALAAYNFFKNYLNSTIYYKPINKDVYLVFHPLKRQPIQSNYKFSIQDYMSAVGIKIKSVQNSNNLKSNVSKQLFNAFQTESETCMDITNKLRPYRNDTDKRKRILDENDFRKATKDLKQYCHISENELSQFDFREKDTVDFFTGGWFEYFVYDELKKLPLDDIKCNVKIEIEDNSKVSNELDVVFIINNVLHIVECKTGETKDFLENTIYKATQIRNQFGLSAHSHLVILNIPSNKISDEKKQRARLFGINLIDYEAMQQKSITEIFKERLKLS